jgi:hypothetical protein
MFRQCGILLLDIGDVSTVWYFAIGRLRCFERVVFCYWTLEMFRQCGILLLNVENVSTVWYFATGCWKCFDSGVF